MRALSVTKPSEINQILCLGAHCDDIEIGCGGTLLSLIEANRNLKVDWVIFASTPEREQETLASAAKFLRSAINYEIHFLKMRDGYLPYCSIEAKERLEQVKSLKKTPDIIFTHYRQDLHQDHRFVNELTWNTFRNHLIFEYEIPKWDGDLGIPNTYSPLSNGIAKQKIDALSSAYSSQNGKDWFTDDLFHSLMRIRGMECRAPSNLAEAFHARKLLFSSQ